MHGIQVLRNVQALGPDGALTALGRMLSEVQADLRVGKMLVFGCMLRCLDAALTIAACLVRCYVIIRMCSQDLFFHKSVLF